ncbi:MAG: hypothetical protein QM741_05945 [Rudaea sp.]|uniref:hypothetical protein n=1 Tax=Rudaea sp. TaxID=2136325 RepID=UPI0039E6C5C1
MANRILALLGDDFLPATLLVAGLFALALALAQLRACLRHAQARKPFAFFYRGLWLLLFALLALAAGGTSVVLRGYRLLTQETLVAWIRARQTAPQQFEVGVEFPDGWRRTATLRGDDWQLDVHVVKWTTAAVMLHAPPLFHVDRLTGRYRDAAQAQALPPSVLDLGSDSPFDLWRIQQRFSRRLPWIDVEYGSSAYLPMVDGARYAVTLSPLGGLIARPADVDSAAKLGNIPQH